MWCARALTPVLLILGVVAAPAHADASAPGAISDPHLVLSTTSSLDVAWTAPTTGGAVTGYHVEYADGGQDDWTTWDNGAHPTSTDLTITGLTQAAGYRVRITPFNGTGDGPTTPLEQLAVALSSGGYPCAVLTSGSVSCWGFPGGGNEFTALPGPFLIPGIDDAIALTSGLGGGCAVLADHTVSCWGDPLQWVDPDLTYSATAATIPGLDDVTAVSIGQWSACALKADGEVDCWGNNPDGAQSNDNLYYPPAPVGWISDASSISVSGIVACASDGQITCWRTGANALLQPFSVTTLSSPTDVTSVSVRSNNNGAATIDICALLSDKTVSCGNLSGLNEVNGISDATSIADGYESACATQSGGTVSCWGANMWDELGPGTTASSSATPIQITGITNAKSIADFASTPCVLLTTGTPTCWGGSPLSPIGTWDESATPVPAPIGQTFAVAATAPQSPALLWASGEPGSDWALDWSAAAPNGAAVTGYDISKYADGEGYVPLTSVPATTHSLPIPPPAPGTCVGYEIVARNALGTSDPPTEGGACGPNPPGPPEDFTAGTRTSTTVELSWTAPDYDGGAPMTGYHVERSTDGGHVFHVLSTTSDTTATVPLPDAGTAYVYRVSAVNAAGSTPSSTIPFWVDGTSAQEIDITTADGQPVSGGLVSWVSKDGNTGSALAYPLTADGVVTFPRVVAGPATIKLENGLLADGTTVTGHWPTVLGTDPQPLTLPTEPTLVTREVDVSMPNGVPVVGANVTSTGLVRSTSSGNFVFEAPSNTSIQGPTGADGTSTLSGYRYRNGPIDATVTYNDGVLYQRQHVALETPTTMVQLQYMPWLAYDAPPGAVPVDTLDDLTFVEGDSDGRNGPHSAERAGRSPFKVTITPPHAWTAKKCRHESHLSGKSTSGRLKLAVCASTSGVYKVKSSGAVSSGDLFIRVKGARPMAPTSLTVRSPKVGQLSASWAAPVYTGGATVTAYRVTAVSKHKTKTVTIKSSHFSSKNMRFVMTKLSRASQWTVSVSAITKYGRGPAVNGSVHVA